MNKNDVAGGHPARGAADVPAGSPMARHKTELSEKAVSTADELERLRRRQEELEREKQVIEQLRENQHKYETGKIELLERLEQSLVSLEREEIAFNQRLEVISETARRFKEMLASLRTLHDEAWPQETDVFREALAKSLALIEDMRKEYHKSLARLEALHEERGGAEGKPTLFEELHLPEAAEKGFGFWLKIGFALTLPAVLALLLLAVVLALRPPL